MVASTESQGTRILPIIECLGLSSEEEGLVRKKLSETAQLLAFWENTATLRRGLSALSDNQREETLLIIGRSQLGSFAVDRNGLGLKAVPAIFLVGRGDITQPFNKIGRRDQIIPTWYTDTANLYLRGYASCAATLRTPSAELASTPKNAAHCPACAEAGALIRKAMIEAIGGTPVLRFT